MKVGFQFFMRFRERIDTIITDYLVLYHLFKKSGCQFYEFIEWLMTDNEALKKLRKVKWDYKRGITGKGEDIFTTLFKELMYVHNLLLDALRRENIRDEMSWQIYDYSAMAKHHYQSLIPKGACPLCPILGEESCDKRPSDYVRNMLGDSKYVSGLWLTLYRKRVWEELLTDEMKRMLEEDLEKAMRWWRYECEKWRDPLACRAIGVQEFREVHGELRK